ncbi:hypothetical protein PHET_09682 [Paragonimus heterotremus]|uniref:Uncharacterized protein n=1 Tax=Paragonimus heterotremus TaxID=100268 RepID=A0A8J4SLQ4_9TREM|nr:hypothetical protein PHET_09682 [Paragonimus heterotremus]
MCFNTTANKSTHLHTTALRTSRLPSPSSCMYREPLHVKLHSTVSSRVFPAVTSMSKSILRAWLLNSSDVSNTVHSLVLTILITVYNNH